MLLHIVRMKFKRHPDLPDNRYYNCYKVVVPAKKKDLALFRHCTGNEYALNFRFKKDFLPVIQFHYPGEEIIIKDVTRTKAELKKEEDVQAGNSRFATLMKEKHGWKY